MHLHNTDRHVVLVFSDSDTIGRYHERKSIGMDAGDGVKRIGRADQPQQLAGRAGSLRELLLSRRSFTTFSCRYGLAEPQPQLRGAVKTFFRVNGAQHRVLRVYLSTLAHLACCTRSSLRILHFDFGASLISRERLGA